MMIPNKMRHQNNIVTLCVDEWKENDIIGRLFHCYQEKPYIIGQAIELFGILERFFDEIQYPQATSRTRQFIEKKETAVSPEYGNRLVTHTLSKDELQKQRNRIFKERGKEATFLLGVFSRVNTSWQGELYWIEEDMLWKFSSDMELMALLDYAIGLKNK